MRKHNDDQILAIAVADLHLSARSPLYRSNEDDWYEAMSGPLGQLRRLQEKYDCPVICAGDVFDRWNSPPELINFALEQLPNRMFAIPGQHDLPDHSIEQVHRSAFETLVRAGKIVDISFKSIDVGMIELNGFAFGERLTKPPDTKSATMKIAVIHEYRWYEDSILGFTTTDTNVKTYSNLFSKWDLVMCGDNHARFYIPDIHFLNCGCLMIRHRNEVAYRPMINLIRKSNNSSSGKSPVIVGGVIIATNLDKYLNVGDDVADSAPGIDITELVNALQQLESDEFDFTTAIEVYCQRTRQRKAVIDLLSHCMERK